MKIYDGDIITGEFKMKIFGICQKLLVFSALVCLFPSLSFGAVSCPSGYVAITEPDDIYVTTGDTCPSGYTKLGGEYAGNTIENCISGLSSGTKLCTFYEESCVSGKYFDGTAHKTCLAGSYCDGTGTAVPGTSGCSKPCPANSNSTTGATTCTCNTGYKKIDGVCEAISCADGYYLTGNTCTICPVGSYCANNIKTECDNGYTTDNTGASAETQCYTTCTKQCTQQTCPDNSINCINTETFATGKQYVGGLCDAKETACHIEFECDTGFEKQGLSQWVINNIDTVIDSEVFLPMCGVDGFGSCDELLPGEWASYYEEGLPIKNATGIAVCNFVPGDDSTFDARIDKNADFDLDTTGNYCWMKVNTVNDSELPASWVYGWQYDSPEQCAQDCGWASNEDFETVELAIIWGAQYDMCVPIKVKCDAGQYLPANATECITCPEKSYCNGGEFEFVDADQGIKTCPYGTMSASGAATIVQCIAPKILHVGDNATMGLTLEKPTTDRVMVFDIAGQKYYGGLSAGDIPIPMNSTTDIEYRVFDGKDYYWMHDYTVQ